MIRSFSILLGAAAFAACTSNANCPSGTTGATSGTSSSTTGSGTSSSGQVGGPLLGPTDNHCWGPGTVDGGPTFMFQDVNVASCQVVDGGPAYNEDAGPPGPQYGPTNYNTAANDDDCKYFLSWRSTPIAKNEPVTFWFTTLYSINGTPVTGLADGGTLVLSCDPTPGTLAPPQIYFEVAGDPDGGLYNHVSPYEGNTPIVETSPGSGVYQVGPSPFFDESGLWYFRFHFNEECCDILPDSPHGHAAFYINVP
jgi:hypothetical protein